MSQSTARIGMYATVAADGRPRRAKAEEGLAELTDVAKFLPYTRGMNPGSVALALINDTNM
ncbi:hypothetical protein AB0O63_32340, partial [Streptomyces cyaneofuscatus]|uniref:hypothetical protein n=1 Tax=Streptomyces cyaneofuscatus TaxID=66883 RepID=UPI0034140985